MTKTHINRSGSFHSESYCPGLLFVMVHSTTHPHGVPAPFFQAKNFFYVFNEQNTHGVPAPFSNH